MDITSVENRLTASVENRLTAPYIKNYNIDSSEVRPWGSFYYINKLNLSQFIEDYFSACRRSINKNLPISPKILIVSPGKKLSWQYHLRRKEIWSILNGPVQIVRSYNNEESNISIANKGDIIIIEKEERHRLIGLDTTAIIAELWCHTDVNNLSDEHDIVRIKDDYNR
jgi:mannose-6-phosphate isomerase